MNLNAKRLLALLAVVALVGSSTATAAGLGLNPSAEQYPTTYFAEDELTIESHDRGSMGWLQYENDNGNIETIDAHVNGTDSGATVSYRADQLEADAFAQFPRVDGEENNTATWLNTSNWTSTTGISVTDTDGATASGVPSVQVATNGSLGAGDSVNAAYDTPSVTDDVQKRYLQLVLNVESLEGDLAVQVRDGGGDYVEAVVNSSRDATADDVIANQTGDGVIFQQQLGEFAVAGSGDGTLDAIEEIRVVARDGDATATVTGLNVQKKSRWDFGEDRVLDASTDESDDYKDETVYERAAGGRINATDLSGMGDAFSDATVHKLRYYNVEYRMQDKPSAATIEFVDADNYPNFPFLLDVSYRRTIATAYDISHGAIELRTNQSFLDERYVQIRYAEGVGDTDTDDISDSSWIDLSDSLGEKGTELVADSTVQADSTYVIEFEVKTTQSQHDALQQQAGGGGFWGGSGGGNPFTSMYNWIAGGIVALLSALGISTKMGS